MKHPKDSTHSGSSHQSHAHSETLHGHVLPGAALIILSLWASYFIWARHFESRYQRGKAYRSSILYLPGRPRSARDTSLTRTSRLTSVMPIETLFKLVIILFGIIVELTEGSNSTHNGHHVTMLVFFGLHGVVELAAFFPCTEGLLPKALDYISAALAFAVEGFLFSWHLQGRDEVNTQLHVLLVYSIVLCCISAILEYIYLKDVRPAVFRAAACLLQGLWFIIIGLILYPPAKFLQLDLDASNPHDMMLVPLLFAWTGLLVIIIEVTIAVIVGALVKERMRKLGNAPKKKAGPTRVHPLFSKPSTKGDFKINLLDSDDDDDDYSESAF